MNRDEKLTRAVGLPPIKTRVNGRDVVFPSEPGGGTWIAVNEAGVCFALVNWYSVTDRVKGKPISRGEVIPTVSWTDSARNAHERVEALPLERMNPFRLIGIFPASREIVEWRWNVKRLELKPSRWKAQQWISSGFDERTAQKVRGKTFRRSLVETCEPGVRWLRQLHRSHGPEAGPFSTCVHRADACTVSFTEVVVGSGGAIMRYSAGCPCKRPLKSECEVRSRL